MRYRHKLAILTAGVLAISLSPIANIPHNEPASTQVELKPDPRQARPLDRWPTQADIERLESVKGRTPTETIRILGHPCAVEPTEDGSETWDYPWVAACRVWFKNGVIDDVLYTAGY
jgi:hypothetical protein